MLRFLRQVAQSRDKTPKRTLQETFSGEMARYCSTAVCEPRLPSLECFVQGELSLERFDLLSDLALYIRACR